MELIQVPEKMRQDGITPERKNRMLEGDELEKRAGEIRSLYTDLPDYCKYPDCFHCQYSDCGWTKAGNEDAMQEVIRGLARRA